MENEITHIIAEGESEENLETEEIQDIEDGTHLNVIPFQLIKLAGNVESEVVEVEQNVSQQCLEVSSKPGPPVFDTAVKGKYSKYYKQTYRPAWEHMPDFKGNVSLLKYLYTWYRVVLGVFDFVFHTLHCMIIQLDYYALKHYQHCSKNKLL